MGGGIYVFKRETAYWKIQYAGGRSVDGYDLVIKVPQFALTSSLCD